MCIFTGILMNCGRSHFASGRRNLVISKCTRLFRSVERNKNHFLFLKTVYFQIWYLNAFLSFFENPGYKCCEWFQLDWSHQTFVMIFKPFNSRNKDILQHKSTLIIDVSQHKSTLIMRSKAENETLQTATEFRIKVNWINNPNYILNSETESLEIPRLTLAW